MMDPWVLLVGLSADNIIGKPVTVTCVTVKLFNVKIYDTSKLGTPQDFLIRSDRNKVFQKYKELATGWCGYHDEVLTKVERLGERVLMPAYSYNGLLVTIAPYSSGSAARFFCIDEKLVMMANAMRACEIRGENL